MKWLDRVERFLEEDPDEPEFDPVDLGSVLIAAMVVIGVLYWLLWTLLVFEGGIFPKISAVLQLAFTSKTLKDFGYEGTPWAMGVFEGWLGNVVALMLTLLFAGAVYRILHEANKRKGRA